MQILINIAYSIISVLIFLFGRYTKSYFDEKGKNLASKEDLKELTDVVEQTKFTFTSQTEIVKSQLSFLTNIQTALNDEERKSIVDYNQKYFAWLHLLLNAGTRFTSNTTVDAIERLKIEIEISYSNLQNSHTMLTLYLNDPEIIEKAANLQIHTLVALTLLTSMYLSDLQRNLLLIQMEPSNQKNLDEIQKLRELQVANLKHHNNTVAEQFAPINKLSKEFQTACRNYLNKSIL